MGAYDKRFRQSDKQTGRVTRPSRNESWTYYKRRNEQETMSYRDKPASDGILLPSLADPYSEFIQQGVAAKQEAMADVINSKEFLGSDLPSRKPGIGKMRNYLPHSDTGHPFWTTKRTAGTQHNGMNNTAHMSITSSDPTSTFIIGGPVVAHGAVLSQASTIRMPFRFAGSTGTQMNTFKPELRTIGQQDLSMEIGRMVVQLAPGRPPIDTFAIFGELIAGFPKMIGQSLTDVRSSWSKVAGDEYLNFVFGIAPTIKDFRDLVKQLTRLSEAILQLQRDQGTGIRRKMSLPTVRRTELFSGGDFESPGYARIGGPVGFPYSSNNQGGLAIKNNGIKPFLNMTTERTVSFAGSFSYVIPLPKGFAKNVRGYITEADRLFGLAPTAASLWQLTPWSWLTDWIYDLSTVLKLQNRVQDDNLVINYGYGMCHTIHRASLDLIITPNPTFPTSVKSVLTYGTSERKERIRLNPYGLMKMSDIDVSPMKISILAALGLSRRTNVN